MAENYTNIDRTPMKFHNFFKIYLVLMTIKQVLLVFLLALFKSFPSLISDGKYNGALSNEGKMLAFKLFPQNPEDLNNLLIMLMVFTFVMSVILLVTYIGLIKMNQIAYYAFLSYHLVYVCQMLALFVLMTNYYIFPENNPTSIVVAVIEATIVNCLIIYYYRKRLTLMDPDWSSIFKKVGKVDTTYCRTCGAKIKESANHVCRKCGTSAKLDIDELEKRLG